MTRQVILLLTVWLTSINAIAQLQSPEQFLGYPLGNRFTPHHRVVAYFEHVKSQTGIQLTEYGRTNELRPLMLAFVSSPENLKNLEQIRTDNLKRTGLLSGSPEGRKIPIVWLSYNVHGNESVSTEASMKTIYELLTDPIKKKWLENTLVVIDPCVNPDGRDRYVEWYNRVANKQLNPIASALEHNEPWPGGRANHYLFDLNRDWAWQTQVESQTRMAVYHQWMPQIHADFHEQGVNEPYYFAPAAEPLHEQITKFQRDFQVNIGRNHAKYFDKEGWLYFTREVFDLFYPSYGDTYPIYNGAIGMTYEQGGSGRAGLGILNDEGDTLTLKDRIEHHYTTGISTVEITSMHADKVIDEFQAFFKSTSTNPKGKYKSYVIKGSNGADKLHELSLWLDKLQIQYGYASVAKPSKGFNYIKGSEESFNIATSDLVVSAYQPKSVLVQVLFEPQSVLSDSLTYDITAWAAPYAWGLDAYAVAEKITFNKADKTINPSSVSGEKPYAYLLPWKSHQDAQYLSALMKAGINARFASNPFTLEGKTFDRGTLIITRKGNENIGVVFDETVIALAKKFDRNITSAKTGFVDTGNDFGADAVRFIHAPKVALLSGPSTSSLSFGETWFFFEQELDYPVTVIGSDYFKRTELGQFDILIFPDGYYGGFLDDAALASISDWVNKGGRLILIDGALKVFADKSGFGLKTHLDEDEKKDSEKLDKKWEETDRLKLYKDRERSSISDFVGGGIFKLRLDNSHPLAFGYQNHYFSLKTGNDRFAYLDGGWNVGTYSGATAQVSGFSGSRVKQTLKNAMVFGVEEKGNGQVIYMSDNPLFRAFWKNGRLLMSNAIFFVGQ